MTLTINGMSHLESLVGEHLGYSSYRLIEQNAVDLFAEATGDKQWIHIDQELSAKGPFGGTIAHGFMTLSLIPVMMQEIIEFKGFRMGVNYGCNKVRFISPVLVGSDIRLGAGLNQIERFDGGVQLITDAVIEIKDALKPACIAQCISRLYL